ncbi:amino acid ABC transporter ATP-binding protein [Paenarthrobacter sp. RAF54_2]|uniref:amino acid ABC transporter ATP-binding protein n=1 Tax=Micrococcaceae TaxID=1268 RepID=UPI003F8E4304
MNDPLVENGEELMTHEDIAVGDIEDLPDADPQRDETEQRVPILALRKVSKTYNAGTAKEVNVLKGINLDVYAGEVVVLVGPSGCGKSTLLRSMNLIAPPDTGSITFKGKTWTNSEIDFFDFRGRRAEMQAMAQWRMSMGMVFQSFNLFPHKTVLENAMIGPLRAKNIDRVEAEKLALAGLRKVGMEQKRDFFPSSLSGGQKQRVAIARALAMQPDVMLFDEATSALDPELRVDILEEMKQLASEGMTMVVVTHELAFAREVGSRVIFMESGQIAEDGPAKETIDNPTHPRFIEFLRALHH